MRLGGYEYVLPDAKSQVSIQYEGGKIKRVDQVVVSCQHKDGFHHSIKLPTKQASEEILGGLIDKDTTFHLNPTGNFVIGGPDGDTGITGRKIIVDTYGGFVPMVVVLSLGKIPLR